jgi:hypothetical protein
MLPRFVKVFPHEYKRVLRMPKPQSQAPAILIRQAANG